MDFTFHTQRQQYNRVSGEAMTGLWSRRSSGTLELQRELEKERMRAELQRELEKERIREEILAMELEYWRIAEARGDLVLEHEAMAAARGGGFPSSPVLGQTFVPECRRIERRFPARFDGIGGQFCDIGGHEAVFFRRGARSEMISLGKLGGSTRINIYQEKNI